MQSKTKKPNNRKTTKLVSSLSLSEKSQSTKEGTGKPVYIPIPFLPFAIHHIPPSTALPRSRTPKFKRLKAIAKIPLKEHHPPRTTINACNDANVNKPMSIPAQSHLYDPQLKSQSHIELKTSSGSKASAIFSSLPKDKTKSSSQQKIEVKTSTPPNLMKEVFSFF